MNEDLARRKLAAFLHDPPHKPLVLHLGHEAIARDLAALLLGEVTAAEAALARRADHLASAADRVVLDGRRVSFLDKPELTHPLSRSPRLRLAPFGPAITPADLNPVVKRALQRIRQATLPDLESAYLAVWRYLPDYLRAVEPPESRLGALWEYLPADTRVPDHSIADHQSITAAIATALSEEGSEEGGRPAFLIFGLGPVQDFISTARTTRDLWAGSFLLSLLSWQAIRSVVQEWGPDCILYPSLRGLPLVDAWLAGRDVHPPEGPPARSGDRSIASFPNKFLALLPASRAAEAAGRAISAVDVAWRRVVAAGRDRARALNLDEGDAVWTRQTEALLERYWVALEWPDDAVEDWLDRVQAHLPVEPAERLATTVARYRAVRPGFVNAGTAYDAAHALGQRGYDLRKGLRNFRPAAEPGFKCTLCGQRAPIFAGEAAYAAQRAAWRRLGQELDAGWVAADGSERLCAVCLTKRLAPLHQFGGLADVAEQFPSTSTVATLPFRRRLIAALAQDEDVLLAVWELVDRLEDLAESAEARSLGIHPRLGQGVRRRLQRLTAGLAGDAREIAQRLLAFDGEWLLPETYERWRRQVPGREPAILGKGEAALKQVLKYAAARCGQPRPYYAVLLADGDQMGRWVTGARHQVTIGDRLHSEVATTLAGSAEWAGILALRRLLGPAGHAALSAALRDFGLWTVPHTLESECDGFVVYAGGDDILALLPAPDALPAADRLRRRYAWPFISIDDSGRVLEAPPADGRQITVARHMGPDASLSAGLVFVHHLYPLAEALGHARALEAAAKERGGRDALGIGVIRRSGLDLSLVARWQSDRDPPGRSLVQVMEGLRGLLRPEGEPAGPRLARRFPYAVRELATAAPPNSEGRLPVEARRALLQMLSLRHGRPASERETIAAQVDQTFLALGAELDRLVDALLLARFLAEEAE